MTYVYVKAPADYPGPVYSCGNRVLEHHLVWWKNTGEVVTSEFVIHHKDENTKNNEFSNLQKLLRGEHTAHHHTIHQVVDYVCVCGTAFKRSVRLLKSLKSYCSKSCAAKVTQNRRLKEELILEIRKLRVEGLSSYKISDRLSISRNTVMKYW